MDVVTGRDRASAVRLHRHVTDVKVIACDLFSGFKSADDTTGAI